MMLNEQNARVDAGEDGELNQQSRGKLPSAQ